MDFQASGWKKKQRQHIDTILTQEGICHSRQSAGQVEANKGGEAEE
jgi:hypothetical protein